MRARAINVAPGADRNGPSTAAERRPKPSDAKAIRLNGGKTANQRRGTISIGTSCATGIRHIIPPGFDLAILRDRRVEITHVRGLLESLSVVMASTVSRTDREDEGIPGGAMFFSERLVLQIGVRSVVLASSACRFLGVKKRGPRRAGARRRDPSGWRRCDFATARCVRFRRRDSRGRHVHGA